MKTQSNPPSGAPSRYSLAFAAAAAGLLPIGAAPLAVPNPSFEARAITDGQGVYNQSSTDSWRHWWRTENGGPCRILNPGISGTLRPNGLSTYVYGFGGTPPDGTHLLMVRSRYSDVAITTPPQSDGINYFSAGVVLLDGVAEPVELASAPFDPTKVYKLTATVGKPIVFQTMPVQGSPVFETDPRTPQDQVWFGYALQLAVGGSKVNSSGGFSNSVTAGAVVAQDANAVSIPVDNFRTVTTTYFPNPADAGGTGEFLQLRLCALDNPANLAQTGHVAYDNIKLEEFAAPALAYWDLNDTGVGAGGAAPTGTWDGASNQWSTSADGTSPTGVWTPGQTAVFSAGTDATGPYSITVSGSPNIGGLAFKNGDVTLTGGTALELAGIGMIDVAPGLTATVETPITQVSPGLEIAKTGTGTLVLSGANNYSGGTTVLNGTLRLAASNVLADTSVVFIFGRSTGNATFDLNGNNDTIGGLVLGGSAVDSAAVVSSGAGTLTLGGDVAYVNTAGNGGNPLGATISGKLDLGAAARTFVINDSASAAADLTVSADISGSVQMIKEGRGAMILSGNNAAATGDLILTEGLTRVDSLASLNGAANDVTITAPGTLAFGPSFGTGNITTALSTRIAPTSNGIIAADNHESHNFDFGAASLTTFLGAVGNVTYTGSITPEGAIYRLGGGGGTLTVAGANALTGSGKSAIIGGLVSLPDANNYDGGTTLLNGTVRLTIGNDGSVGTGPLTFAGGDTSGSRQFSPQHRQRSRDYRNRPHRRHRQLRVHQHLCDQPGGKPHLRDRQPDHQLRANL